MLLAIVIATVKQFKKALQLSGFVKSQVYLALVITWSGRCLNRASSLAAFYFVFLKRCCGLDARRFSSLPFVVSPSSARGFKRWHRMSTSLRLTRYMLINCMTNHGVLKAPRAKNIRNLLLGCSVIVVKTAPQYMPCLQCISRLFFSGWQAHLPCLGGPCFPSCCRRVR